jgi:hypothetical protein
MEGACFWSLRVQYKGIDSGKIGRADKKEMKVSSTPIFRSFYNGKKEVALKQQKGGLT